ncbi:MAG: class I SAM-dependent methyltransferase [Hyphomicrobiales bacterium]|nr:class I SAM-dependent methyltransferase [Hyphomicrobiales bacterium]
MSPFDWFHHVLAWTRVKTGKSELGFFDLKNQELSPSEAPRLLAQSKTDLERIYYTHEGRIIHKWTHYLPIYDKYLSRYRGQPMKMMEIGVFKGGSLQLWRNYFGNEAHIVGVDINPDCAKYVSPPNVVKIGSQADAPFLASVADEMGPLDIVLDDGSHIAPHQRITFKTLFPRLKPGGIFIIEDTHTAYWPGAYEGGYRRRGTAIEFAKELIDDQHSWYHNRDPERRGKADIGAIHFYDSMIVIEKQRQEAPAAIKIGTP